MAVDADFRPEPGPYAVAVLATFAAVLIRWLLDPMLGDGYPLALVFAALALAVYIGGIGPAVVALLLGYLLSNFLFIEPRGVLSIGKPREEIAVPLYLLGGGMIMYLGDAARRARRRAERLAVLYREAERETQRLNVELNARIRELDTLLEVLPVGVLICERGSDEYRGNPAAFQLMGATGVPRGPVAALKSAPAEAFIARASVNGRPASLDELPLARAFNRGESIHNFRFDAVAHDGRVLSVLSEAAPLRDEQGTVHGAVAAFVDLTEVQRAQAAVRASEERLSLATRAIHGYVYDVDVAQDVQSSRIRVWRGHGLRDVIGVDPDEAHPDVPWWESRVHPDDLPTLRARLSEAYASGADSFVAEYRVRHRDGHYVWIADRAVIQRDAGGRVVRVVGNVIDISAYKQLEKRLEETIADLGAADRSKDEFLATLAHELRNPLAPIRNAVELLRRVTPTSSEIERVQEIISRQVRHMTRMIDDLLDVSRITMGRIVLHRERVRLDVLLQQAVEAARPAIEAARHELTVSQPATPVEVDVDPTRMSQVIVNLLDNAAKYTVPGGRIWLSAWREGDEVVVSVRDTGEGIALQLLPRVFDLFIQGDSTLERRQGGLGIGLTLVDRLVKLHGGSVEARSPGPGQGSEFLVRLPVASSAPADDPMHDPPRQAEASPGARHGRRILVADDNVDAAESLSLLLQASGHEIRTVYDGAAAVEEVQRFRPDVVFLDIGMPRMNGYDAARAIRALPGGRDVVLIAITGWGQAEDRRKAAEAGFDHHLTKPADPEVLHRLLEEVGTGRTAARPGTAG